ncbi:unnamed protein product [Sympodiomycopsis kandeliae]
MVTHQQPADTEARPFPLLRGSGEEPCIGAAPELPALESAKGKGKQRRLSQSSVQDQEAQSDDEDAQNANEYRAHTRYTTCSQTISDGEAEPISPVTYASYTQPNTTPRTSDAMGDFSFGSAYDDLSLPRSHEKSMSVAQSPDESFYPSPSTSRSGMAIRRTHRRNSSFATSARTNPKSSLGSHRDFDFFSTSVASTAPTSAHSFSCGSSPQAAFKPISPGRPLRSPDLAQLNTTDALDDLNSVEFQTAQEFGVDSARQQVSPEPPSSRQEHTEHCSPVLPIEQPMSWLSGETTTSADSTQPQHRRLRSESLPGYGEHERLPEYIEQEVPGASPNLARRRIRVRSTIASHAASSRIIPNAVTRRLQASLQHAQESEDRRCRRTTTSAPRSQRPQIQRSDSSPEYFGNGQSRASSPVTMYTWSASQFYTGAMMGPSHPTHRSRRSIPSPAVPAGAHSASQSPLSTARATTPQFRRFSFRPAHSANSSRPVTPGDTSPVMRRQAVSSPLQGLGVSAVSEGGTPEMISGGPSRSLLPKDLRALTEALFKAKKDLQTSDVPSSGGVLQALSGTPSHLPESLTPTSGSAQPGSAPAILGEGFVERGLTTEPPMTSHVSMHQRSVGTENLRRPALLRSALNASTALTAVESHTAASAASTPRDLFHSMLPREIRLRVIRILCLLHIQEHQELIRTGEYRGQIARQDQPAGHWRAMQELINLSRVSKIFASLVLDGQLWQDVQFSGLSEMRFATVKRVLKSAGSFVTRLDLANLGGIGDDALVAMTKQLSARACHLSAPEGTPLTSLDLSFLRTSLTSLDLSGLRKLSSKALVMTIQACPDLRVLSVRDVPCVDSEILKVIGQSCAHLRELDLSRCAKATSSGLVRWREALNQHCNPPRIEKLKVAGISWTRKEHLRKVVGGLVDLQVLDLSRSKTLGDGHLETLVGHGGPVVDSVPYVQLTARQAGSSNYVQDHYRAKLQNLKHLNLSATSITDRGCCALAYGALPVLEVLELADCAMTRDDGLVALLESLARIRRIDLDGIGHGVTERVLQTITPPKDPIRDYPGSHLTHLTLSRARGANADTLLAIVESCPKLYHLEVDNTEADDRLTASFVQVLSQRRLQVRSGQAGSHCGYLPPAYLSVVDCRLVTRPGCNALLSTSQIRGRLGQRGPEYNNLSYSDPDAPDHLSGNGSGSSSSSTQQQVNNMLGDECNPDRLCVKTYWYWQMLDRFERERRKQEAKRLKKANQKRTILNAVSGKSSNGAQSRSHGAANATGSSSPGNNTSQQPGVDRRDLEIVEGPDDRLTALRDRVRQAATGLLSPMVLDLTLNDDDDDTRAACVVM